MAAQPKRKTIDRLVYYPVSTFDKFYQNCLKLNIPMNTKVLEFVEEFNTKMEEKKLGIFSLL